MDRRQSVWNDEDDTVKTKFMTLIAEGDKLYNNGQAAKALEFYTQALALRPHDKHGLVARSKCHLRKGDVEAALHDAEQSLARDKSFYRGLYQKAEALYQKGDFEMALVFYHRGHKMRPELDDFTLGIQKAQEAIINCVGSTSVKLTASRKPNKLKANTLGSPTKRRSISIAKEQIQDETPSTSVQKTLLAELYSDKEYLVRLNSDNELMHACISTKDKVFVGDLVTSGIDYLVSRAEFWRQQKPLYARKLHIDNLPPASDPVQDTIQKLTEMETVAGKSSYIKSIKLAEREIKRLERCTEKQLQQAAIRIGHENANSVTKNELICELATAAGNTATVAYQTTRTEESFNQAETFYKRVIKIRQSAASRKRSDQYGSPSHLATSKRQQSEALDRLGRLYVIKNDLKSAIKIWEKRESLITSQKDDLVVLYHDMGRAYLTLKDFENASHYSHLAYTNVVDQVWKMNVMVLLAEIHLASKEIDQAKRMLENCWTIAREHKDHAAEKAVSDLLERLRIRT